jgi:hypothetical protein
MTRWASSLNSTAAAGPGLTLVTLCILRLPSNTFYLHDGLGTLTFGGNTYSGLGDYGKIDSITETTETIAKGVIMTLSGIPSTELTDVMTEDFQGQIVTLYIGLLDSNSLAWIATPEELWEGRLDYATVDLDKNASSIAMHCENRLNKEPLVARYTDEDQQLLYPGDSFFNLVWQIPLAVAGWGQVNAIYPPNILPTRNPGASVTPKLSFPTRGGTQ